MITGFFFSFFFLKKRTYMLIYGAYGVCTILKAWFDETFVIPDPVQASGSGNDLLEYPIEGQEGFPLTVGGELNKLAYNIGVGRELAGIHYRSDVVQGFKPGEQVAITLLKDRVGVYNEPFTGWSFQGFDGNQVDINKSSS